MFATSLLCCPIVLGFLGHLTRAYTSTQTDMLPILFGMPLLVIVGAIIAIFRIGYSRGALRGHGFAFAAIGLSVLWLGSCGLFLYAMSGMQ